MAMLTQGLQIMFVGMMVVFIMLSFIIVAVSIASKIIHTFVPAGDVAPATVASGGSGQPKGVMAAVVAAAIAKFKKDQS
jgi:sodium pump decarboxylase gamma subunit